MEPCENPIIPVERMNDAQRNQEAVQILRAVLDLYCRMPHREPGSVAVQNSAQELTINALHILSEGRLP